MNYYPLKLNSVTKSVIWGGTQLSEKYGKGTFSGESIAEAWTLTLRDDGINIIENGEYSGMSLKEYASLCGMDNLCGYECNGHFPLLVKLIDACDSLSVQVHPDDAYAHSHGLDAGKTEMWYIVDAKPGAKLVYGLNKDVPFTSQEFKEAAENGKLEKYLKYVEVKKGDVFYIPAGLVHAIGAGILIAEIQQNSNTTFRIYDFNRVGKDGKKRELHIEKALEAMNPLLPFGDENQAAGGDGQYTPLASSKYFNANLLTLSKNDGRGFEGGKMLHFVCLDGEASILASGGEYKMKKGDAYLTPSAIGFFTVFSKVGAKIITAGL